MMLPILKSTTLLFSTLISLKSFGAELPDAENVPPPAGEAPVSPPHAAIDPAFITPDQPTKPASTNAPARPQWKPDPLVDRVLRFED